MSFHTCNYENDIEQMISLIYIRFCAWEERRLKGPNQICNYKLGLQYLDNLWFKISVI